MKPRLKSIIPASVRHWLRLNFGWRWFRGDYAAWAEARAAAAGYDDAAVLARVLAATHEVRAGRAAFERDGVAFAEPAVNPPLLVALRAARTPAGRLEVVDFGGALGSTWWQHRDALAGAAVRWRVVEQPHYVSAGKEFADAVLGFHDSLDGALVGMEPSVILFSSVLPYVENPVGLLAEAARRGFKHVIIDRTPFVQGGRSRLVVQHTSPSLGGGSYPCWLFGREELLGPLAQHYQLLAEWPALDKLAPDVSHAGFHFRRRS